MDTLEVEKLNVRLSVEAPRYITNSVVFKLVLQKSTKKINKFSLGFGGVDNRKAYSRDKLCSKTGKYKEIVTTRNQIVWWDLSPS